MSRAVRLIIVAALAAGGLMAVVPPASAAPCVRIYRIYYNSPGGDNRSNSSLNAEWIRLKNYCGTSRSLTNWRIKDAAGHTYTFGTFKLGGSRYVKVHTGHGTNTSTDRYWGSGNYIWNNDKDTAYLRNRYGNLVDKCSYNNSAASSVYC
jgi:hypothetical protein